MREDKLRDFRLASSHHDLPAGQLPEAVDDALLERGYDHAFFHMILLYELPELRFDLRRPIFRIGILDLKVEVVFLAVLAEDLFQRYNPDPLAAIAILACQILKIVTRVQLL